MAKTQKGTFDKTNTGTLNANKDQAGNYTDRRYGKLNIGGTDYNITGTQSFDGGRPVIDFSLNLEDTSSSVFGKSQVVSDDGQLKLNRQRRSESAPEFVGSFSIGKQKYRLSGWGKNHPRYGDFLSLAVKTEEEFQRIVEQYKAEAEGATPEVQDSTDPLA